MKLSVNGKALEIPDSIANQPLVWVLHDQLALNGTRLGCGAGLCGSCSVHLDTQLVRSCQVTAQAAREASIRTLEGLAKNGRLHPVQQIFLENPLQCNYCVNGHIMTAVAFLEKNLNPTDSQIEEAINVNLCRCGGYFVIRENVQKAATLMLQSGAKWAS
jgi:aerobic-type carbon monoxide dehydrogenase small subunit (CoxS/CutS family)